MLLDFDIRKAIAATAFLIEREGGTGDLYCLVKELYYADRSALIKWGKSITGDSLASMKKGPIVSGIYDLMRGKGDESDQIEWDNVIQKKPPYGFVLRKHADLGILSECEKSVLEESRKQIRAIRGSISKWMDVHCPEWQDPGESSTPIDPSIILRLSDKSEEEIRRLEEANEEIKMLNLLLGVK